MTPLAAPRDLSPRERLAWLQLARADNVGPATFFKLLQRFDSAEAALDGLPDLATRLGRGMAPASAEQAEAELEACERLGARLIAWGEPDYPERLAQIADPPPLLTVLGEVGLLHGAALAVVGARNASAAGQRLAQSLAEDLGKAGLVIVSGLARGIDAAAHRGALATGTVAVLAGGIDVPYPPENVGLYQEIAFSGTVVAELGPGSEPKAKHFPRRNRIIAGLSQGVLVVEAALRSGSLLTARMALDEGRELFAVPGSPLDPRCRGSNDLLRQGATLTETAEDVTAVLKGALAPRPRRVPQRQPRALPPSSRPVAAPASGPLPDGADPRAAVLEALGPTPVAVDELVRRCQLSPALLASVLLDLELDGRLERHPGQRVSLA